MTQLLKVRRNEYERLVHPSNFQMNKIHDMNLREDDGCCDGGGFGAFVGENVG